MGPRRLEMERLQTPTNRQRPTQPTSRRRQLQPSQRRLRPSHLPQRRLRQRHLEPLKLTQLVARKQQLQLQLRPPLRLRSLRLPHGPTQSRQKLPIQSPHQLQRRRHHPKTLLIAGVVLTIVGWLALYMLRSHLGSALGGTKKRSRSRRR